MVGNRSTRRGRHVRMWVAPHRPGQNRLGCSPICLIRRLSCRMEMRANEHPNQGRGCHGHLFLRATPRIGEHGYGYGKSWRGNALWFVLGEIEICLLIMTITTEWEENKSRTLGQESERGKGRDWVQTRVFATLRILGRHGMHLTSSSKTPSTRPSCHEEHRTG